MDNIDNRSSQDKLKAILDSWKNMIFNNPEVERIANHRANICSSCPHNMLNVCNQCGCPIYSKVRASSEKCPLIKW